MKILRYFGKDPSQEELHNTELLKKEIELFGHTFDVNTKPIKSGEYDLYHASGTMGLIDLIKLLRPIMKKQIAYELTEKNKQKAENKKSLKNIFVDVWTRIIIKNTRWFLMNKDIISNKGPISEKKFYYISSGIETEKYKRIMNKQIAFNINFVCPDPIERKANLNCVIDSLKYLPIRSCLYLTGEVVDNDYLEEIKQLVKNYNLENRVVFKDSGLSEDILRSVSFGFSSYEGSVLRSGLVQLLLAGIPVVTNVDHKIDVKGLIYVNTVSGKNLAKILKKQMDEADLEVDIKKVKTLFGWQARAKDLVKIYKFMLRSKNGEILV